MAITGETPNKIFSFDIYLRFTGGQGDFKLCAHSLRIVFNGDELEKPGVPIGLSAFYKRIMHAYTDQWDTLGYFYLMQINEEFGDILGIDLSMALMDGMYSDQGYTSSLLPLMSGHGEQLLCRIEFEITHDDTFTIPDAGLEWDNASKGDYHFDSAVVRKKLDENCESISDNATYEIETVTPTPTPTSPGPTETPTETPTSTPTLPGPTATPTATSTLPPGPTKTPTVTPTLPHPTRTPAITPTPTEAPTQEITPVMIETPNPTATPVRNYINLGIIHEEVSLGGTLNLWYLCDFIEWPYQWVPVDIYLAVIRDPKVIDEPSSVEDALAGGMVYIFGKDMKNSYIYEGKVGNPTYHDAMFKPGQPIGYVNMKLSASEMYKGNYVFVTAFIRRDTGEFVRTDGKPVETSNLFRVK